MKKLLTFTPNIKRDCLVTEPSIIKVNKFNEESFGTFMTDLDKIRAAGQPIIPIHIDSFGGQVYTLLGMISMLNDAKEKIMTYTGTKAMSCGAILLSCGTPGLRFVSPYATILLHSVSNVAMGKINEIEVTAEHGRFLNDQIFEILSKNAGRKKNFFKKYLKKHEDKDIYLTPQQAVDLGIADKIGVPTFVVAVEEKFEVVV